MRIIKVSFGGPKKFGKIYGFVYCGREFGGFEGSLLGNPYRVGRDGTLAEVLEKYRAWLLGRIAADDDVADALKELKPDSVLGCWCLYKDVAGSGEPKCHCDVIAQVWQEHCGHKYSFKGV